MIAADPAAAQERRRAAEADGEVSYRRRQDGLGDLFATAMPGPLLQAVLARVREAARPWGSADDRTAGKRRLDALVNLILGRETLPTATDCDGCDRAAREAWRAVWRDERAGRGAAAGWTHRRRAGRT